MVVGIPLDQQQRDRLRESVADKLHAIQPQIDPTLFEFNLHCVSLTEMPDSLYVAELVVPAGQSAVPYYTGGHEMSIVRLRRYWPGWMMQSSIGLRKHLACVGSGWTEKTSTSTSNGSSTKIRGSRVSISQMPA